MTEAQEDTGMKEPLITARQADRIAMHIVSELILATTEGGWDALDEWLYDDPDEHDPEAVHENIGRLELAIQRAGDRVERQAMRINHRGGSWSRPLNFRNVRNL